VAVPSPPPAEVTQPFTPAARLDDTLDLALDAADSRTIPVKRAPAPLPPPAPAAVPKPEDHGLDFDLDSLGTDSPTVKIAKPPAADPTLDFGEFSIGGEPLLPVSSEANAPLARKLELAEEFRQIGDLEGARDLLEEVVAKGEGALQAKAQGMLDKLA
jgi:pilus assembly protein FimV